MHSDLSALDSAVLLELPRLDGDLPLHLHLRAAGRGLPGVHVRRHLQILAAQDHEQDAGPQLDSLLEGDSHIHDNAKRN